MGGSTCSRARVGSSRLDPRAIRVVMRQAPGSREHRQGPSGRLVPSHRDRHIMEPRRVLRNLQGRALIPHRMVRGHAALVLHTQAPGEGRADPRDAGGARLRRPPPHPLVMLGEDLLGQVPISRRPLRKPRQGPLVRQSVRHGADGACRPTPLFRRRGGNQREAPLLPRVGYLGQPTRVPVATGCLRVPGVGAPIRIQGT